MYLIDQEKLGAGQPRPFNAGTIFLAIVVTIDVFIAVVTHWNNYDWMGKVVGSVLMLSTGIGLFLVLKKPGEGEKNRRVSFVTLAYIWLLLATILFNR